MLKVTWTVSFIRYPMRLWILHPSDMQYGTAPKDTSDCSRKTMITVICTSIWTSEWWIISVKCARSRIKSSAVTGTISVFPCDLKKNAMSICSLLLLESKHYCAMDFRSLLKFEPHHCRYMYILLMIALNQKKRQTFLRTFTVLKPPLYLEFLCTVSITG